VTNRSAQGGVRSSLHYGGEGDLIHPTVPRCLRAARYGRFMRDPRRTLLVLGWRQDKGPYKGGPKWETMSGESSDNRIVPEARGKPCDREIGSRMGWGRRLAKEVGESGRREENG
jgi:hypothetical protein